MKKIIIVGATSGIGLEVARLFLKKGYILGLAGRRTELLEELRKEYPHSCFIRKIDVTSNNASEQLLELIGQTGGMDLYLHSAGIGKQNPELEEITEFNTIATNVEGFTRLTTTAFHFFRKQKNGHLCVISSIAGTKGIGLAASYSATKRYQNTYIEALEQLARNKKMNIQFTDIRPGFVDTDLLAKRNYPMLMDKQSTALKIVSAIEKKKRVAIIDGRYNLLVAFWQMIPKWIWVRLPLTK